MPIDHTEKAFETALTAHLLAHGYIAGAPAKFDAKLALDPSTLVGFLQTSQDKGWARLTAIYGGEVAGKVVATIARDLDHRGMLECLRRGVTDRGVNWFKTRLDMANALMHTAPIKRNEKETSMREDE